MERRTYWITFLSLVCLGIYLFASAPPPLEEPKPSQALIPVAEMFAVLEAENDVVRMLWAQEFVGEGKKVGLKFHEHWRDADVEAGPLPAQFLRETAKSLEKNPSPLSLFLGSDYPINPANRFDEAQLERFHVLRQSRQPQFFYMADTGMQVGMFEDVAVADACIQCHNKHEESPKKDWALHDVMGATTWLYPASTVSLDVLIRSIAALKQGFDDAYAAYLDKVKTFSHPPEVGEHWPHEGYFVPSAAVFKQEVLKRTAPHTLQVIEAIVGKFQGNRPEVSHVVAR